MAEAPEQSVGGSQQTFDQHLERSHDPRHTDHSNGSHQLSDAKHLTALKCRTQQAFVHLEDNVWLSKCIIYILYFYIILYDTILYCINYNVLYSYLWELRPWSSSLPLNLQAEKKTLIIVNLSSLALLNMFELFWTMRYLMDRQISCVWPCPNLGPRLFATPVSFLSTLPGYMVQYGSIIINDAHDVVTYMIIHVKL